jgi:hypothetical protein
MIAPSCKTEATTTQAATAATTAAAVMSSLILKRASASRQSGQCRYDDHVLEDGVTVGRIFKVQCG